MSEARLPGTGEIEVVPVVEAVGLVEDIARDTDAPRRASAPRLVVLDIDGTVLLEDESLSPGVVDAVARARGEGHEVMLATGRSWEGTRGVVRVLGIEPEYVVCSNGAVVMKRVVGAEARYERFHVETFDASAVLTLLREHLPDAHYLVELPDGRRLFTEYVDDWHLHRAMRVPFEELAHEPVTRVVVVSPEQSERDFVELVERIGLNQVSYAVGWTAWLDIAPKGVDKSTALELVRGWLGIDPTRVIAMGDGRNDIGMLGWALAGGGRAVAMGQGPREVHDAAGESTSSVADGGVARILDAL